MKKSIVISVLLCIFTAALYAKPNPYFKKGYLGNVELSAGAGTDGFFEPAIMTTHGYSFGKGFFGGFGAGLGVRTDGGYANIPFYMDVKYSAFREGVSPFLDMKFGGVYDSLFESAGIFASPSAGIDIGRWSVFLRYTFRNANATAYIDFPGFPSLNTTLDVRFKTHVISIGAAINF